MGCAYCAGCKGCKGCAGCADWTAGAEEAFSPGLSLAKGSADSAGSADSVDWMGASSESGRGVGGCEAYRIFCFISKSFCRFLSSSWFSCTESRA